MQRQLIIEEDNFTNFGFFLGFSSDLVGNLTKWKFLYEAKEPDNLPLHEPWHSRLNRFQKLVNFLETIIWNEASFELRTQAQLKFSNPCENIRMY